jgi:hypothetical protein
MPLWCSQRTFMYGDAEATKLTLFKMRRDTDFNRWQLETDEMAGAMASAGFGPSPTIAYWKRSPTGAHKNGVFVGSVFDNCAHCSWHARLPSQLPSKEG